MVTIEEKGKVWLSPEAAAEAFSCSKDYIRKAVEEMSTEMRNRYPRSVISGGRLVRVNYFALCDWLVYRKDFRHGKPIPPFDASAWRKDLAMKLEVNRV